MLENLDIIQLVTTIGYIGIFTIIFVETGLFFGFFLPGDSLLFAAGLLASKNIFNIWLLVPVEIIVAIAGYFVAYWIGGHFSSWLLKRKESFWFKRAHLKKAEDFYNRHGGKALILGRLVPIVRTFAPIVAGMVKMPARTYALLNVIGAIVWAGGVTIAGYFLGRAIPNIEHYILPLVLAVIAVSLMPAAYSYIQDRRKSS